MRTSIYSGCWAVGLLSMAIGGLLDVPIARGGQPDAPVSEDGASPEAKAAPKDFINTVKVGQGAIKSQAKYYVKRNDGVCVPAFGPIRTLELLSKAKPNKDEAVELIALKAAGDASYRGWQNPAFDAGGSQQIGISLAVLKSHFLTGMRVMTVDGDPFDESRGESLVFLSSLQGFGENGGLCQKCDVANDFESLSLRFGERTVQWTGARIKPAGLKAGMLAQLLPAGTVMVTPLAERVATPSELAWSIKNHGTKLVRFSLVQETFQPMLEIKSRRNNTNHIEHVTNGPMQYTLEWKRQEVPVKFDESPAKDGKDKQPGSALTGPTSTPERKDTNTPK